MAKYPLTVRKALGKKASLGPIPADMVVPSIMGFILALMARGAFNLDWPVAVMLCAMSFVFYFFLVGPKSWKFYSLFIKTPTLMRIIPRYLSPSSYERNQSQKKSRRTKGNRRRR
ncbi:hypothetical protein C1752_14777 [Acaryochloris thomasi RCC1774]|uniref:Uncharacterized protein n=1 Tax=Acaryochloris thomasi RCC1774 TaxID=1764569 RepID=A0A2W1JGC6_9CYAN|nr:hypothetical protein [Acaryochloris thomasi]PZD70272.1 hypothetical protein C1752_14777 [Acaryochloris thomasi RCC1774]